MSTKYPELALITDFIDDTKLNCNYVLPILDAKVDLILEDFTVKTAATPTSDTNAGAVLRTQDITLACATSGASIYYTRDGSAPTNASILFEEPINLAAAATIKAKAYKGHQTASNVLSVAYTILKIATPVANPVAGEVAAESTVTITCATPGAWIYYTTDGETPTAESEVYTDPIVITAPVTIKAIAILEGADDSVVLSAAYTVAA